MTLRSLPLLALAIVFGPLAFDTSAQEAPPARDDTWLPTLITDTPQQGFELAVTLSRRGVTTTQPDRDVLRALRPGYAHDADSLIAVSQVVAVHFQTIAAANNYWRSRQSEQSERSE